jgi:hypothetical protein
MLAMPYHVLNRINMPQAMCTPAQERLTSTLTPASARAFNCCSVAKTGLSVCGAWGDWRRESSGSAGVTEEVDLRGGILVVVWRCGFGVVW